MQVLLAILTAIAPPAVAEKLLVSICLLALPLCARCAVTAIRPDAGAVALLTLPLAFSQPMAMGFYGFSLSLSLFLLTVGLWLRRAEKGGWRVASALGGLSLLLYFAHPIGLLAAWISIAAISLGRGGAVIARAAIASLPTAALSLWYAAQERGGSSGMAPFGPALRRLVTADTLVPFDDSWRWLAWTTVALFAVLLVVRVAERRRDPQDLWLGVLGLLVGLYFIMPDTTAGGSFISARLALICFFPAMMWLASGSGSRAVRRLTVTGAVLIALAGAAQQAATATAISARIDAIAQVGASVEPGSTVLTLTLDYTPGSSKSRPMLHAGGYVTSARRAIALDSYQAACGLFPVRYRESVDPFPTLLGLERPYDTPRKVDPDRYPGRVDYVLILGRDESAPWWPELAEVLKRSYTRVRESDGARLWRRAW